VEIPAAGLARLVHAGVHAAQIGHPGRPNLLALDRRQQHGRVWRTLLAALRKRLCRPLGRILRSEQLIDVRGGGAKHAALLEEDCRGGVMEPDHGRTCAEGPWMVRCPATRWQGWNTTSRREVEANAAAARR